ncbi:MAG: S-layer homology domain-containing protein, partial [Clostridia bacterium]|nr:S-layer homology domain-containing protein [Clostridia bacterium]
MARTSSHDVRIRDLLNLASGVSVLEKSGILNSGKWTARFEFQDIPGSEVRQLGLVSKIAGVLLLATAVSSAWSQTARARDPWYVDVSTAYWAYDDIRILWEEEVSDGWLEQRLVGGRLRLVSVFRPDQVAARAEYGMMMVKAFRLAPRDVSPPSYADVPADLLLYDRILAQPWLEAGLAAGMLDPPPVLRPLDGLRRDAATAALVRALGLTPFSQRLSAAEVASLLGRFPDGADTDPALAGLVALAVHLRILEGYPDGTLQPGRLLSRAEAATILARAALFGLKAAPNPASPDGDGIGDTITFSVRALRNRNASRWGAYVGDLSGYVRKALADGLAGAPPPTVVWDGRDDTGARLPPGVYYYWGWLEDVLGQRY